MLKFPATDVVDSIPAPIVTSTSPSVACSPSKTNPAVSAVFVPSLSATKNDSFPASSVFADWMHVAVTYNGVGGNTAQNGLKLYINGVRSDTADSTKNTYTAMHNTTTPLRIGAYHESLFGEGSIDEAAIFNAELSATDIANIYNSGAPADLSGFSSLVSWWRFEEGSGTTATDSGTGGNNGTINGATYQTDVPS